MDVFDEQVEERFAVCDGPEPVALYEDDGWSPAARPAAGPEVAGLAAPFDGAAGDDVRAAAEAAWAPTEVTGWAPASAAGSWDARAAEASGLCDARAAEISGSWDARPSTSSGSAPPRPRPEAGSAPPRPPSGRREQAGAGALLRSAPEPAPGSSAPPPQRASSAGSASLPPRASSATHRTAGSWDGRGAEPPRAQASWEGRLGETLRPEASWEGRLGETLRPEASWEGRPGEILRPEASWEGADAHPFRPQASWEGRSAEPLRAEASWEERSAEPLRAQASWEPRGGDSTRAPSPAATSAAASPRAAPSQAAVPSQEAATSAAIRVVVRVRPPLPDELRGAPGRPYREAVTAFPLERRVVLRELAPVWPLEAPGADGSTTPGAAAAGAEASTPGAATPSSRGRGGTAAAAAATIGAPGAASSASGRLSASAGGSGPAAPARLSTEVPVLATHAFTYDAVFGPSSTQREVYEAAAKEAVRGVLGGINATIIAYGQTGTGKTWTMAGAGDRSRQGGGDASAGDRPRRGTLEPLSADQARPAAFEPLSFDPSLPDDLDDLQGIVPRAVDDVFRAIESDRRLRGAAFLVRASYAQIYNEVVTDLLKGGSDGPALAVREDRRGGTRVEGLSEWVVRSPADVAELMERGARARATGSTRSNDASSRSHAIFTLVVEACDPAEGSGGDDDAAPTATAPAGRAGGAPAPQPPSARRRVRVGKLNLVDLAGSERVAVTGATGARLEESKKINQSLSCLGNVVAALAAAGGRARPRGAPPPHVPYRESKLTRILEDSLGGNCRTTFLATLAPGTEAAFESLSTLKFARRAARVVTTPTVNEDLDQRTLLRRYERELRRLRAELAQKSKDLVDKRLLLEMDAARRREEADKLAAISALERQAAEISRHKAMMAGLQTRISALASQLLVGGGRPQDSPAFRSALEAEQARVRRAYADRLSALERERGALQADREAAGRARQLLARQRDVMAALTARLAERDAAVLALRDRAEIAETAARKLGDALDARTAELLAWRRRDAERRQDPQWSIQAERGAETPGPKAARAADVAAPSPSAKAALDASRARVERLGAERSALRSILGTKMRGIVEDLRGALDGEPDVDAAAQRADLLARLLEVTSAALSEEPAAG